MVSVSEWETKETSSDSCCVDLHKNNLQKVMNPSLRPPPLNGLINSADNILYPGLSTNLEDGYL